MPDMTDAEIAELVNNLLSWAAYHGDILGGQTYKKAADALEQQARDLAAARWKLCDIQQDMEVVRERTIEEIAQFIENEPIHSWVPRILAKRIRALTKSSK